MPSLPITALSQLKCPHAGMVQIITKNAKVTTHTKLLTLATDQFVIVGCTNQVPCTQVLWVGNPKVLISGQPTVWYSAAVQGLCLALGVPQGPVVVLPEPSSVLEV